MPKWMPVLSKVPKRFSCIFLALFFIAPCQGCSSAAKARVPRRQTDKTLEERRQFHEAREKEAISDVISEESLDRFKE